MTRLFTLFLLTIIFAQSASAGGPWPRKKNSGYAQLGFTYVGYSKFFNHEGQLTDLRRPVTDFTSQLYLDFGLTDRLTMTANLPFKYVSTGDRISSSDTTYFQDTIQSGNLFGLSNVMLGLKYNIIKGKDVLSAGLNFEVNTSKYDSLSTLRTGPSTFVIHPYLSIGSSIAKFYIQIDAGYRIRLKNYSDELDFNFELGYSWNQKTYFIANVAGRSSIGEGNKDNNVTVDHPNGRDLHTSLYPNNQQFLGYGLKFIQKIKKIHINAAVYSGFGNMVAAAPSYNLGVAYEW